MRDDVLIPPQTASQFGQSFRKRQNLRERSSNEKKKDSGGLSAVVGVLVVLPTTAKA
jgi:hypothetical protein